jgi:cellulose synthase/poly-beta-1,6-N-acetylglucosamine synthase-like glycosyltransferase
MLLVAWIILLLSSWALLHTYLIFPFLAKIKAGTKVQKVDLYTFEDPNLPFVTVISSFFNEEKVAIDKITSLQNLHYPKGKYQFYIGSDASTDKTNQLVTEAIAGDDRFHFFAFPARRGKPPVINELVAKAIEAKGAGLHHIFLLTDANVMMHPEVMYRLVRHFKDPGIALVDAHMRHVGMQQEGISQAENQYLSAEVQLKNWESKAWQLMMGPFGGCYALRADYFCPVPANYLVDDFFIAMKVFEKGGKAINDLEAHCYEAVSHEMSEEYRRKRRISAGNFQNLFTFRHLWWPPFKLINRVFFSHKVLRWLGPFFMIAMLFSVAILSGSGNLLANLLFVILLAGLVGIPILDWLLAKLGLNLYIFRGVRYFVLMNLALLEGFFKYLKGIKSNVWQPTKRN